MRERYLEVTYRRGRALAAYLYLPRPADVRSARTEAAGAGLLVDYGPDGAPIGIEIADPRGATADAVNRVLAAVGQPPLEAGELAPLGAA